MSKKFSLFASVAMPLVSLPLMIQPAGAMPPAPQISSGQTPGLIRVQERVLPPGAEPEGGAEAQEEQPRRRERSREETPEAAPEAQREAPAEAEQPTRRREAEPERERPRRSEREPERQEEPQAEQPAEREAAPQRRQREAEPERQERRESAPERQAEPGAEPEAEPEAERPRQRREQPERQQRQGSQERQREEAPAEAEPQREQAPESRGAPAEREEAPARRDRQDRERQDGDRQDRERQEGQGQDRQSDGQRDGAAEPERSQDRATGTDTERTPERQAEPENRDRPSQETSPGASETGTAPAEGGETRDGAETPAAGEGQQRAEPQPPTTPEEVERARKIAEDPASAPADQPVVLPVEGGAAVLDSAKEGVPDGARDRQRRRDGQAEGQPRDRQQPAEAEAPAEPPRSDAEAQAPRDGDRRDIEIRAATEEEGERLDRRPEFERQRGWDYREVRGRDRGRDGDRDRDRDDGRVIITFEDRTVVRHDDSRRFYREGYEPEYERLRGGRVREVIERDNGVRIVTIRNRYGEIVQRSRIVDGEEYVLYYAPELMEERPDYEWRDPGLDLPPMRLTVPVDDYIIDTSSEPDRDYYEFLDQPPVERVERVYSLDEVRYSARLRDKVRRIDLDTIRFATGSAEIPMNEASSLKQVADAINRILEDNPAETFLIEGHTDAVGSDESNLVLSDERAESVAVVLTDAFGIPPENLATQGYGERYLKVRTDGPEQENRRVTIRRITPLVKPVASNQ